MSFEEEIDYGDQPAAINGVHLDSSQNDTAREEFHSAYPVFEQSVEQQPCLLGKKNTQDEEMKVMLGIWKPRIYMNSPVCDHPALAVIMDASTFFLPDPERPYYIHIDFIVFVRHNLNGSKNMHADTQKWYYYSFQKDTEVLVFIHVQSWKTFCQSPWILRESKLSRELRKSDLGRDEGGRLLSSRVVVVV
jgi:hypothetical protein